MGLRVQCQCGRQFNVPEDRAAKPFKCFVCQRDVIPSAGAGSSLAGQRPAEGIVQEPPGSGTDFATAPRPAQPVAEPTSEADVVAAATKAAYRSAAEQMVAGVASQEIERQLVEKGCDSEAAGLIVGKLQEARSHGLREAAQKNMLFGALWCIGGLVVTALTYLLATNLG